MCPAQLLTQEPRPWDTRDQLEEAAGFWAYRASGRRAGLQVASTLKVHTVLSAGAEGATLGF